MKLVNFVVEIMEETLRIILYPKKHWLRVKTERDIITGGFRRFFMPGLLLVFLAVVLGDLMFESEYGFLFKDTLIKAARKIAVLVLQLFAANMLLYEISRIFKVPLEFETSRKIATYSMLPMVLLTILLSLFPFLDVLGVLGLYSLYLVYSAVNILFDIQFQRNISYVFLLLTSIFASYLIFAFLLSKLTALIIY